MLFNSIAFAVFLPIVFLIYWAIGCAKINDILKLRLQNAFVVVASYVFYGWWDWRFLLLIAFTSFCSWGSGLLIGRATTQRISKAWMIANVVINLAILGVFKYYDFFVSEFGQLFGIRADSLLLRIILPVGISFYTFQALSYSIDVYRNKIEQTNDILAFFAFISFFPQLVAGPIERATNLLPQFLTNRKFSYDQGVDGMRQILWGLFKKIVIADNCATYVNQVWENYEALNSSSLLLAAILFAFQIYGDFSGYSDIAIGTAKLFGIKLMRNFNNPYFSRDIAEFWRRWHISLTTWFRDYVYIPLGGSRPEVPAHIRHSARYKKWIIVRNTFIIFLVSGFWHGANWTFIAWGAYHAILFLPLILTGANRKYTSQVGAYIGSDGKERLRFLPTLREFIQILLTFFLVVVGLIIFRANTIHEAWDFLNRLCSISILSMPLFVDRVQEVTMMAVCIMFFVEWLQREKEHGLQFSMSNNKLIQILHVALYTIALFGVLALRGGSAEFIYFQF